MKHLLIHKTTMQNLTNIHYLKLILHYYFDYAKYYLILKFKTKYLIIYFLGKNIRKPKFKKNYYSNLNTSKKLTKSIIYYFETIYY